MNIFLSHISVSETVTYFAHFSIKLFFFLIISKSFTYIIYSLKVISLPKRKIHLFLFMDFFNADYFIFIYFIFKSSSFTFFQWLQSWGRWTLPELTRLSIPNIFFFLICLEVAVMWNVRQECLSFPPPRWLSQLS